jgi:gamma-glutamyltranspeptidase / glutathione hydrolase
MKKAFFLIVNFLIFSNTCLAAPFSKGVIVSKNELASLAGAKVLEKGGNAIDAAIATGYTLGVVEPQGSGIGGGGFALIYLAKQHKFFALDFRERAPAKINEKQYEFVNGPSAGGIPGLVKGFEYLHENYGNLPRAEIMQMSIDLAENGSPINKSLKTALTKRETVLKGFESSAKIFLPISSTLKQKDLSQTLKLIAKKGGQEFYSGSLAQTISQEMEKAGGVLSKQDLENYKIYTLKPICDTYRKKYRICSFPPPSSGGVCLLEALNILENFDLKNLPYTSTQRSNYVIEALKVSFADRAEKLGDPRFNKLDLSELTSKKYAKKIALKIKNSSQAFNSTNRLKNNLNTNKEKPETTHWTVADKEGNLVVITASLNGAMGSGFVIPKTGILLNNTLDDFSLPVSSNQYGLIGNSLNYPMPNKTPLSSMSPTIVFDIKTNKPILALGSPGGPTIISAVLNTLLAYLDHKMTLEEAVAAGRIHHQFSPNHVHAESWIIDEKAKKELQGKGHIFPTETESVWKNFYWTVQAIELNWKDKSLKGASDPRAEQGLAYENPNRN